MVLLAGVFLRDLQFDGFVRFFEAAEQRRNRFARLEVDWAMFDLDDDVVFGLAVERMEIVVGSFGAVVFGIAPVEVMIVDESTIKHDAVMRLERACDDVGGVRGRAAIEGRAKAAFGIGFDDEAAEVGNGGVNSVAFLAPPIGDAGIEWIECVETSDGFGTGKINGNRKLNAPWTKDVGDTDELREVIVPQKPG